MGEADLNRLMRLRNQLVPTKENFAREGNLSPVLIPTMSKDTDGQFEMAHKVIDVLDQANRRICVTLLRYNVEKPYSSYAEVRVFAKKKEEKKFQQIVCMNYKLDELMYLLGLMDSVYDKVFTNKPIFNVL